MKIRSLLFGFFYLFWQSAVYADWQLDTKLGAFLPNLPEWETYYGSDLAFVGAMEIAYKPLRFVDAGIDMLYLRDSGSGGYLYAGTTGGEVINEMLPGSVFLNFSADFFPRQWIIPYAGTAFGRITYRQQVKFQPQVIGNLYSVGFRGGMRILLNHFDPSAAKLLREEFGIRSTYLTIEARRLVASKSGYDLGGDMLLAGVTLRY